MQVTDKVIFQVPLYRLEDEVAAINDRGLTIETTEIAKNMVTIIAHPWVEKKNDSYPHSDLKITNKVLVQVEEKRIPYWKKFFWCSND